MPGYDSAAKRHRQSLNRRMRNRMLKTRVRTEARRFQELVDSKARDEAASRFKEVESLLDRAVSKGVLHRNTAARKKQRLYKKLVALG